MSTRIDSPATITIDTLNLNYVDDLGVEWAFSGIDGWHDGPTVGVDQIQRIVAHGQFPQSGHRGGRPITIEGWIGSRVDSRAAVASAVETLISVLADGAFGTFTFEDDDRGPLTTRVQLLERPSLDWSVKAFCRYQLAFLAPDPYRYGATAAVSTGFAAAPVGAGMVFPLFPSGVMDFGVLGVVGTGSVRNNGTASSAVVFTITGPAPVDGFTITDTTTGKRITYLGDLPTGSTLVMDGSDGSVVINGTADRLSETLIDSWPTIAAGAEHPFLFEPIGAPTAAVLTISTTSTYW